VEGVKRTTKSFHLVKIRKIPWKSDFCVDLTLLFNYTDSDSAAKKTYPVIVKPFTPVV